MNRPLNELRNHVKRTVSTRLPVFALVLMSVELLSAAPPHKDSPHVKPGPPQPIELQIVVGKVISFVKNGHGDVDGIEIGGNLQVHFPPHVGKTVLQFVKEGADVRILGQLKSSPKGEVIEVVTLESNGRAIGNVPALTKPGDGTTARPIHDSPKKGPGTAKHEPAEPMTASGTIASFHLNKDGAVDGFKLAGDNQPEVKFPPHQGKSIQEKIAVGEAVTVVGDRHETPHGDLHLHVREIKIGDQAIKIDRPEPKQAKNSIPAKILEDKKPKADGAELSNRFEVDVMHELREIRALILAK